MVRITLGLNYYLDLLVQFFPSAEQLKRIEIQDWNFTGSPFIPDTFYSRSKISNNVYYAALLHDHPDLIDDCCMLINTEWKRSREARLRSISGSSDNFPTSVILLKESKKPRVIGHCKLSKISHSSQVVFVETVVIHPDFRGKGLGKLLMQKAEQYLKSKNIEWVYLTTMGQKEFYEKLGYSDCEPVNIYGGQLNHLSQSRKEMQTTSNPLTVISHQCNENNGENFKKTLECSHSPLLNLGPPPPPPPPPLPPMPLSSPSKIIYVSGRKTFMRKKII